MPQSLRSDELPQTTSYRRLAKSIFAWLTIGIGLVAGCYFWVDRPVAWYVYDHGFSASPAWKDLTLLPPLEQTWSPLVIALLLLSRVYAPWWRWQVALSTACLAVIVADQFRVSLGDASGRYWPETWFDHNPSLIGTGTYGFHPFARGDDTGSFPSGHATRIAAFTAIWWIAYPRIRLLYGLIVVPMLVALVAMNYHFVGDVVAGTILGGIVGRVACEASGLETFRKASSATGSI